jgi:hypothetical protein
MAFGYEANAVAIHSILDKKENIILTHRNIAYNLAFDLNNFHFRCKCEYNRKMDSEVMRAIHLNYT